MAARAEEPRIVVVGDAERATLLYRELCDRAGAAIEATTGLSGLACTIAAVRPSLAVVDGDLLSGTGWEALERTVAAAGADAPAIVAVLGRDERAPPWVGEAGWIWLDGTALLACTVDRVFELSRVAARIEALDRRASRLERTNARLRRKVDHATGLFRQVEDRLKLELSRSRDENEDKTQFIADFAHEVRTPLTAIVGFVEIMEAEMMGPLGNDTYRVYARLMQTAAAHLVRLTTDALELARSELAPDTMRTEDVEVAALVGDTVRLFSQQARAAGVSLESHVDDSFPILRIDGDKLRQVLNNLIANAIKFTPSGGRVSVVAKVDPMDGAVILVVSDTGVGIDPRDLTLVMKPWRQAGGDTQGEQKQGLGLGLPLVRRLAERMGARFEIRSRPGVGTAVSLTFPKELTETDGMVGHGQEGSR